MYHKALPDGPTEAGPGIDVNVSSQMINLTRDYLHFAYLAEALEAPNETRSNVTELVDRKRQKEVQRTRRQQSSTK